MSVFAEMAGQEDGAIPTLQRAAEAAGESVRNEEPSQSSSGRMTHAWLFVGPAGSGRSVAARAFAASLQCEQQGCGQCVECTTSLAGTHADVSVVVPEGLTLGVDVVRELVLRAASAPSRGRWHVILVEDADRLTLSAANALLKAIEEPAPRTVFLLCAPSTHPDDLPPTVVSRCRIVSVRMPSASAVADILCRRDDVDPQDALFAAQVTGCHVGRARRLATDPAMRARREAVLAVPRSLVNVGACFTAADVLLDAAQDEAVSVKETVDSVEKEELSLALGAGGTGKGTAGLSRGTAAAHKELVKKQKARSTRVQRDTLDLALMDLAAFYRDVLVLRFNRSGASHVALVHPDMQVVSSAAAAKFTPESIIRRLDAIVACQKAIAENVKPRIAVETMMLGLYAG